jgi:hypothetical protein
MAIMTNKVFNPVSSLILSSANGPVSLSGNLYFPVQPASRSGHIVADGVLILSGSSQLTSEQVYVSGSLRVEKTLYAEGAVSCGGVTYASSYFIGGRSTNHASLSETLSNFFIRGYLGPIILTSSAGSTIIVSGTLSASEDVTVLGDTKVRGKIYNDDGSSTLRLSGSVIAISGALNFGTTTAVGNIYRTATGVLTIMNASGISVSNGVTFYGATVGVQGSLILGGTASNLYSVVRHLTLSCSAGSIITASGSLKAHGQIYSELSTTVTPTSTSASINWNDGNVQFLDLGSATGHVTASFSNSNSGGNYLLIIIQHPSAPKDIVWPTNTKWPDGVKPVITSASGAMDIANLLYDGVNYYANIGQNYL